MMSRNSKARRDTKKRQEKKHPIKVKTNATSNTINSSELHLRSLQNPFSNLPSEERKKIIAEASKKSRSQVKELLDSIEDTLKKYDPNIILGLLSSYSLTQGVGEHGVEYTEFDGRPSQASIELLQAICLLSPKEEQGYLPPPPHIIQKIWDELKSVNEAFSISRMTSESITDSETDQAINMVQEFVRGHTQNVRNWGFHSQVLTICTELYSYFDEAIQEKLGFSATSSLAIFEAILEQLNQRLAERFKFLKELSAIKNQREMVRTYYKAINQDPDRAEDFIRALKVDSISRKNLFLQLMSHYDIRITELFLIDLNDLSQRTSLSNEIIKKALNYFSLSYGDLANQKREFLFFENPICKKPVISLNEKYYCMTPQVFFSFAIEIFDEIIDTINKKSLHDRRSSYLEEKIEEIVKRRFPESHIVSGLKWEIHDNTYETDLIAFIDSHAIIFEAKSQKISRPALRGAPERIKRHLQEIFIEPSIQSARLEARLDEIRKNENISESFSKQIPVDINKIKKIVRISISLEDFATLQTNFRIFQPTGWIPEDFKPCACMNLADFETLFDLFEHPVQIIHYLTQRNELESKYHIVGDELDLMGLYLSNLFNMEYTTNDTDARIIASGMSEPIDVYYMSREHGISVPKPLPKTSDLFKSIFEKLEERGTPRWTEIGCILNKFPYKAQIGLVQSIKKLSKSLATQNCDQDYKNLIILNPPQTSQHALAIVLFNNRNKQNLQNFMEHAAALALEPENINYALIISLNTDQENEAYSSIALCGIKE